MKSEQEKAVVRGKVEMDCNRDFLANGEETLEEDKAFLNRMKTIPARAMQSSEIQRLTRIAWRGMEART
ncbi:hypothetical protein LZ578_08690 [Jeotgalibaca sp. MA1X17-3]|uniref:hypothetical protein n=1 Tax=Jeotgalibaca sp. MA1X17-3 TaxID=2908211 RepID=UPI001F1C60A0|nr:hypothetical protein [Jeotgalibaca sp. MA1X17-3]UJF15075.1 hypothetical protein LZ578_08690 [Jeotgalibaca sp. MA1X17-3]